MTARISFQFVLLHRNTSSRSSAKIRLDWNSFSSRGVTTGQACHPDEDVPVSPSERLETLDQSALESLFLCTVGRGYDNNPALCSAR